MRRRIALLTVMAALLTCSFFNGPVQAETHTEVIESTAKSQLDSTVLEKVKAALGEIAKGNEMKSDLKVMANASDNIHLEGELSQPAARFNVGYDKKKQRVDNTTIYCQIKDKDLALESAVLKKVNAFIAKFEDKKYPLTFSA